MLAEWLAGTGFLAKQPATLALSMLVFPEGFEQVPCEFIFRQQEFGGINASYLDL